MTLAVLGSLAAAALAQAPAIAPAPASNIAAAMQAVDDADAAGLTFRFTPGAWLARLGGTSKLGNLPASDEINLETEFDLDDRETSPNFELAIIKNQRWQIDVSAFDFSTETTGTLAFSGAFGDVAFSPGDAYEASLDMTSVALSVSFWQWDLIDSAERGGSVDLEMAGGAGVRWLSVEQSLSLPGTGAAATGDGEWLIPELIFQVDFQYRLPSSFPILDTYEVLALASIGPAIGGDGGTVATLRAGMRFWLASQFSVDFGYRLLECSVESDEFEFTGGLQGLFLSGTIRF